MSCKPCVAALFCLALVTTACVSLSLAGERVRITTHESDVVGCTLLGEVKAEPPFHGPKDAENQLRNEAAKLGGDVVLRLGSFGTIPGKVYDCGGKYAR